ncbi:MAG TPA: DUF4126 domain-containing protein [Longimicrobiales bacterium]
MISAPLIVLGQIVSVAFAAGLNLYATIALLGVLVRLNWIAGLPPAIYGLSNPVVLVTAAVLYAVEFFIDKVPYADSAWDAVHTIVRPVAVFALVFAALAEASLPLQITGAALAGLIALATHGLKAGLRLLLNVRPRKVRTAFISVLEDVVAAALAAAALMYPSAALIIAAVALPLLVIGGPYLWRVGMLAMRAFAARLRGFFGRKGWRGPDQLPPRLRRLVETPQLGRAEPRLMRAALKGVKGVGNYKNGWIAVTDDHPVFLYLSLLRPRKLNLPPLHDAQVRRGIWTDAVEIQDAGRSMLVILLKDGPRPDIALTELRGHSA